MSLPRSPENNPSLQELIDENERLKARVVQLQSLVGDNNEKPLYQILTDELFPHFLASIYQDKIDEAGIEPYHFPDVIYGNPSPPEELMELYSFLNEFAYQNRYSYEPYSEYETLSGFADSLENQLFINLREKGFDDARLSAIFEQSYEAMQADPHINVPQRRNDS